MGPGLSPISCSSLRISSGEREESSSSYLLVSAAAAPLAGRLRGGIASLLDCPLNLKTHHGQTGSVTWDELLYMEQPASLWAEPLWAGLRDDVYDLRLSIVSAVHEPESS